jgi:hypothetical protein
VASAERFAELMESHCSTMLRHLMPTEPGPSDEPTFDNSDDELEHLHQVAERIRKRREIEELRRLIAG